MPAASVSTTALPATAFGASRLPACPPLRAAPDGPPCRHSQLPAPWLLPHPAAVLHTHSLRRDVPGFKTHLSHYLSVLTMEQMMDALVNYGAVSVVVTVQGFPLGPSMQTIICAPISGPNDPYLDQVVVVVGWQPCQVSGWGGREAWSMFSRFAPLCWIFSLLSACLPAAGQRHQHGLLDRAKQVWTRGCGTPSLPSNVCT